ncbi:transcription antitermination protein NusG, partial [mine drainage metagenome]
SVKVEHDNGSVTQTMQLTLIPVIVAVKTTVGNEIPVSRDLAKKSEKDKEERSATYSNATNEILAIMAPKDVKGYVFVETMHPDRIPYLGKDIRGYKGEVKGEIAIEEIEHYLEPKPAVTGLELGALIELIDGPFKGERAKIMSIDRAKEEVTVQLIESLVPIPVTVNAEAIRMLDTK